MLGRVPDLLERLGLWPSLAIAFCGGLALALGAPPEGLTWLIWLGFLPIALVVRRPDISPGRAFLLGWVGGLCIGLVGFPWIAWLLERWAGFSPWLASLLLFVFSAWTAIPVGLWGVGTRFGPCGGWRGVLWPCALWVALSAIWPAIFPYTPMIGLAEEPAWIQAAELGGVGLVEAQVVACGVLLADAIVARKRRQRWIAVGIAALIPVLSAALGSWRMAAVDADAEAARTARFGIMQPNTPLGWANASAKVDRLRRSSRVAQERGAQLVVWPEAGVYPYVLRRPVLRDSRNPRRRVLIGYRLPTIFGAPSREPGSEYGYNSVFNMAADGRVLEVFDKVNLMPFGEYIPIVDPEWARSYIPALSHNLAGEGPKRFEVELAATSQAPDPGPPIQLGPLVCYEDIFPQFARKVAALGIHAFVNVTIDTWFGDTAEPWEHLALAQFRSVEHRIPMVRSVSTGVSTVVDHNGRIAAHLDVTDPSLQRLVPEQLIVKDVRLPRKTTERPTPFARFGFVLPWVCQLVVLLVALAPVARNLYRRAPKEAASDRTEDD